MINVWNNTDPSIKSVSSRTTLKHHLTQNNPKPNPYYELGSRLVNIIMARIRMGCSELTAHLFANHVHPNPLCQCGEAETAAHYFLECPVFTVYRLRLANQLRLLNVPFTIDTLLHGTSNQITDRKLIEHIEQYITGTERFSLISSPDAN